MTQDQEPKRELTDAELEKVVGGKDVVVRGGGAGGWGGRGWNLGGLGRIGTVAGRAAGGVGRTAVTYGRRR